MTKTLTAIAGTTARGGDRLHALPPLQWWRGEAPERLDQANLAVLRETLSRLTVLGLTDWHAAVQGEAWAAVGIALGVASRPDVADWLIDAAASALLLCALVGSPAAALVLAHLRRRFITGVSAPDRRA